MELEAWPGAVLGPGTMQQLGSDTFQKCFGCQWLLHAEGEAFVQHNEADTASLFAPQGVDK